MALTRNLLGCTTALILGLCLATAGNAATIYDEITASPFFNGGAGPEAVGPGIDQINGTINGSDNGDLFRVVFDAGGTLIILARGISGQLNPSLFLFDALGGGLRADNDSGPLSDARIEVAIAAGTYYIGAGDDPLQAVDTDGSLWDATAAANSGPPGSFGTLARIQNTGVIVSPGDYRITLSMVTGGAAVPEPMTLALLGLGVLMVFATRRHPRPRFQNDR